MFQKKMLDNKLDKIKAYRKQFEDDDRSFLSFKEKKSGSPMTPKIGNRMKGLLLDSMMTLPFEDPFRNQANELPLPIR